MLVSGEIGGRPAVYLRSVCVSGFTFSPLLGGRDGSSLGVCAHTSTTSAYAEAVRMPVNIVGWLATTHHALQMACAAHLGCGVRPGFIAHFMHSIPGGSGGRLGRADCTAS